MPTRLGIELSPVACRIIEVDAGPGWRRHADETRVRSFALLPPSGPETRARLESLRKRHAAVVVWTGPATHRQVVVTGGSYESMRAEALRALGQAGLQTRGVWADIAPVSRPVDRTARRPVVVALASAAEMSAALQPLVDAGIHLRTVTTPAMALGSLARLRRAFSVTDGIEAYVALEEDVTCVALVRAGVLIAARDLAWGYVDLQRRPRQKDDMTALLADAITDFVAAIGGEPADIGQVCVCGGLPELRSMTVPLIERIDVELEPLDSLFGIDVDRLPQPADEFRERIAELRLVWAVAADRPPMMNLLRARRRQDSKKMLGRAAIVAGVAAGSLVAWRIEQSPLWRTTETSITARTPKSVPSRASSSRPASPSSRVASPPPVSAPPPAGARNPPVPASPTVANEPPVTSAPSTIASQPPATTPPAAIPSRPGNTVLQENPLRRAAAVEAGRSSEAPPATVPPLAVRSEPIPARGRPASSTEVALPMDAELGTILYARDRKLAIVDGRIVGVGDQVRGARVIDITPNAVMLRDEQGRLRRLAFGTGAR